LTAVRQLPAGLIYGQWRLSCLLPGDIHQLLQFNAVITQSIHEVRPLTPVAVRRNMLPWLLSSCSLICPALRVVVGLQEYLALKKLQF
jgi:hypothetical protein